MVQLLGVIGFVGHCAAVHAVVAVASATDGLRQLAGYADAVAQHHLEPEADPANVANRGVAGYGDLLAG